MGERAETTYSGVLRELSLTDAPALLELIRSGAAAGLFLGDPSTLALADAESFILSALLTSGDDWRAVSAEGSFAGLIGLKDISRERAEFCIALTEEARHTGLARAAAAELLCDAFSAIDGPERVFMYTRADNAATRGFNRAMGFRPQPPEAEAESGAAEMSWYGIGRAEFLARHQAENSR